MVINTGKYAETEFKIYVIKIKRCERETSLSVHIF